MESGDQSGDQSPNVSAVESFPLGPLGPPCSPPRPSSVIGKTVNYDDSANAPPTDPSQEDDESPGGEMVPLTLPETRLLNTHVKVMQDMHKTFFTGMDRRVSAFEKAFDRTSEQNTQILTNMSTMQSQMLDALLKGQEKYETLTLQMTHVLAAKTTSSVLRKKRLGIQVNKETELLRLVMGQTQENCYYTNNFICEKMLLYDGVGLARTGTARFSLRCGLAYDSGQKNVNIEEIGNKKAFLSFGKDDKSLTAVLSSELLRLTPVDLSSHADITQCNAYFAKKDSWSETPNVYWKTGDEFIKNLRDHVILAFSGKLEYQAIIVFHPLLAPQQKGRGKGKVISFSASKIMKPTVFSGFIQDRTLFDIPNSSIEGLFKDPPEFLPNPIKKPSGEKVPDYLNNVGLPHQIYEKPITWRGRVCYDMTAVGIWVAVASKVCEGIELCLDVKQRILAALHLWAEFIKKIRTYYKETVLSRHKKRLGFFVEPEDKKVLGTFQPYFLPSMSGEEQAATHYESYVRFVETNVLPSVTVDGERAELEIPYDCDTESLETKKKGSWVRSALNNIFDFYLDETGAVESLLSYYNHLYVDVNKAMGGRSGGKGKSLNKIKHLLNQWNYDGPAIVLMEDEVTNSGRSTSAFPQQSGSKRKAEECEDTPEPPSEDISERERKRQKVAVAENVDDDVENTTDGENDHENDGESSESSDDDANEEPMKRPAEKCPRPSY